MLFAEGKLVGNLSASDLRGVAVDFLLRTILRPAHAFLELVRGEEGAVPIVATYLLFQLILHFIVMTHYSYEDSFGSVVKKILDSHVHRVWIVDFQGKLDTIVSLSDICRVFAYTNQ